MKTPLRDRVALWLCNLILRAVATSDYRDRLERLTKQKIATTLAEALVAEPGDRA